MLSSSRARAVAATATLALVVAAGVGVAAMRTQMAEAEAAQRAEAEAQMISDVRAVRTSLTSPVRDGRDGSAALRVLLAEAIAGSEREPDRLWADFQRRVETLRDAAARLEAAGSQPLPVPPADLGSEITDPVFRHLDGMGEQALVTARHLLAAADAAESVGAAAHELTTAAMAFADTAGKLPDSDDPDAVAAAWRAESDRLEPYRAAAEAAAEIPELAELAAAHIALIDRLDDAAEAALDDLDAGDIDAYNERREEHLAVSDAIHRRLLDAIENAVASAVSPIEAGEERALGLLTELERLRRDTPVSTSVSY